MQDTEQHIYIAIDLKSFYASVECRERDLDPLTTNLVVADSSRTEKTICLAVSPSLKAYGISGRARLFEVVQKVKEINIERKRKAPNGNFTGSSYDDIALKKNKDLELTYIVAPPRMGYYMKYSTNIYNIYLKWFSKEDIYVYSIDEVFIDVTHYLKTYNMKPRELATKVIQDIYNTTGITATAGIGTNLYLCKVAMDIVAKHVKPNENGVRIAGLDEKAYRKLLWEHRPLTDFWRVGKGYATKLEKNRIYTMGDVARTSIKNEELLYKLFGINAELLIDHAWGYEPVTLEEIKAYKPLTLPLIKAHMQGLDLNGNDVVAIYPMLENNLCQLLVFDFDNHAEGAEQDDYANADESWKAEIDALRRICKNLNVDAVVERSRSGRGAHLWIFFKEMIPARLARRFGFALLEKGAESVNLTSFKYYDRMIPAQDALPEGGLGNVIALPLQGMALKNGNSAFVDENWNAYEDQLNVLAGTRRLTRQEIEDYLAWQ